jgi:enamine deaminase RidA (YjgF/YER057c/UK114 family)
MVSGDLIDQIRQALEKIVTILEEADARPEHIVRLTWYVTDLREYQAKSKEIGEVYRSVIGRHYPAMSLFEVAGLVEKDAKVEIEATAVLSI